MFLLCELIDTLWNVNYVQHIDNHYTVGINRYIMECKYRKRSRKS